MREQNRELMQSLEEIRRRDEESKQLNQELGDTNRGVVALYAELDERAEQLRKASELKSRFLSHMSHEFRTPLNSVLALSRLLLDRIDGELTAEQERQIGYIRRSAESLLELVNDLLDLSKVEAGKVDIKPAHFTVAEFVRRIARRIASAFDLAVGRSHFRRRRGYAGTCNRRGKGRADSAQPHFQCAQVHREWRSSDHRPVRSDRRHGDLQSTRYRDGHSAAGSGADLRGILSDRQPAAEGRQRHWPRTAVVAVAGRTDRRLHPRRKRAGPGLGLHPHHSGKIRRCRRRGYRDRGRSVAQARPHHR